MNFRRLFLALLASAWMFFSITPPAMAYSFLPLSTGEYIFAEDRSNLTEITKYDEEGNIDTSFGSSGTISSGDFPESYTDAYILNMAEQVDGKVLILFATDFYTFPVCARLNADGSLDTDFGTAGFARISNDTAYYITSYGNLVLDDENRIVFLVNINTDESSSSFTNLLVRLASNGTADTNFGGTGIVELDDEIRLATQLAIQPDNQILSAGDTLGDEVIITRVDENGNPDSAFGGDGVISYPDEISIYEYDLKLQADGRIILTGRSFVARFLTNGDVDTSFGTNGSVAIEYVETTTNNLHIQDNGKIIILKYASTDISSSTYNTDFRLLRLNSNGETDTTYGDAGEYSGTFANEDADGIIGLFATATGDSLVASRIYRTTTEACQGCSDCGSSTRVLAKGFTTAIVDEEGTGDSQMDVSYATLLKRDSLKTETWVILGLPLFLMGSLRVTRQKSQDTPQKMSH